MERRIEICLSPALIPFYELTNKIVVIVDIFRATSTMITALAHGVKSITPVADLETCRRMSDQGYITAGERNGKKEAGFELGNSPLAFIEGRYKDKKVAMTTTNGTLAIEKSKPGSAEIILGAFINLQATADYLSTKQNDVIIVCAGWKGRFNLEDSVYAGALSCRLSNHSKLHCDAVQAMENLYEQNAHQLRDFLNQSSHAKRLQNHNIEDDIDFCLQSDVFNIIAKLKGDELVL